MKYLVANWKAQMSYDHVKSWVNEFRNKVENDPEVLSKLESGLLSIIFCPSHQFILYLVDEFSKFKGVNIGSQDVSIVKKGKFTGEVTAESLDGLVDYSIIGHSERRKHFNENEQEIEIKMAMAAEHKINTILCIRNDKDAIYESAAIVAYEPETAIGSGANADVKDVLAMKKLLDLPSSIPFLYGGSADSKNMSTYLETNEIDGFLVGTASLDPNEFFEMAKKM